MPTVAGQCRRSWTQARSREVHQAAEGLELAGLVGRDAEVAESDLVLRPGQHGDPIVGAGSTMAVDEVEQLVSGARHHGPHQQAGGSSPGHPQGLAQREDGVEHVAGRLARLLARSQLRTRCGRCRCGRGTGAGLSRSGWRRTRRARRRTGAPPTSPTARESGVDGWRSRRRTRRGTPCERTTWRRPGGRGHRRAARGPVRCSWSRRSRARGASRCGPSGGARRRRIPARGGTPVRCRSSRDDGGTGLDPLRSGPHRCLPGWARAWASRSSTHRPSRR